MARIIDRMGRPVTLTPVDGLPRQVTAVYTSRPGVAMMMEGFSPSLQIKAADAAEIVHGTAVDFGGRQFAVSSILDDSVDSGIVTLVLEAQ